MQNINDKLSPETPPKTAETASKKRNALATNYFCSFCTFLRYRGEATRKVLAKLVCCLFVCLPLLYDKQQTVFGHTAEHAQGGKTNGVHTRRRGAHFWRAAAEKAARDASKATLWATTELRTQQKWEEFRPRRSLLLDILVPFIKRAKGLWKSPKKDALLLLPDRRPGPHPRNHPYPRRCLSSQNKDKNYLVQ